MSYQSARSREGWREGVGEGRRRGLPEGGLSGTAQPTPPFPAGSVRPPGAARPSHPSRAAHRAPHLG